MSGGDKGAAMDMIASSWEKYLFGICKNLSQYPVFYIHFVLINIYKYLFQAYESNSSGVEGNPEINSPDAQLDK